MQQMGQYELGIFWSQQKTQLEHAIIIKRRVLGLKNVTSKNRIQLNWKTSSGPVSLHLLPLPSVAGPLRQEDALPHGSRCPWHLQVHTCTTIKSSEGSLVFPTSPNKCLLAAPSNPVCTTSDPLRPSYALTHCKWANDELHQGGFLRAAGSGCWKQTSDKKHS